MKTCLLLIDNQQALFDEGPADAEAFLGRLVSLLAGARSAGIPVVHVQHAGPSGDELEPGQPGWELHPAVRPLGDEPVFGKKFNSSFKDTGLEAWLRDRGITDLVIAGMQTEHCIDATVKSAFEKGFRVTVPIGAHTTFANGGLTADQVNEFYSKRIWRGRYAAVEAVGAVVAGFRQE